MIKRSRPRNIKYLMTLFAPLVKRCSFLKKLHFLKGGGILFQHFVAARRNLSWNADYIYLDYNTDGIWY